MSIEELRKEINEITKIFQASKYALSDLKYIHSVRISLPVIYSTFYFFIERMYFSTCVNLILNLCKLFDKREKFSLDRLCNKMQDSYSISELCRFQSKSEFDKMCNALKHDRINLLMHKVKTTRDEYYAHFDRTRTDFQSIKMNAPEFDELISVAETFIRTIELKFFDVDVDYELPKGEMGYNLFERLNEWEEYREKYGLLRINQSLV